MFKTIYNDRERKEGLLGMACLGNKATEQRREEKARNSYTNKTNSTKVQNGWELHTRW